MDNTYGGNPQSSVLHRAFHGHPKSHINPVGEPVIPADALVDVLFSFSDAFNGIPLLSEDELSMLEDLLAENPDIEVTPGMLLKFISAKTAASTSPAGSPDYNNTVQLPDRGRSDDHDMGHSRSSSRDSSRPPSRGPPQTPNAAKSPLDSERRQRSTPLTGAPPSSWSKRPPAHRRKSDAGSRSDSEGGPPSSFSRSGRVRAPSNPASPSSSSLELNAFSPVASPTPHSRPPSRQGSQSGFFGSMHFPEDHGYSSPDETAHRKRLSFGSSGGFNTIPLPRANPASTDSDEEEDVVGLVTGRDFRASDAAMDDFTRLETLKRQNDDLKRKRAEYEEFMARKVAEHEADYADLQASIDQLQMELGATKREEKELRSKERQNMQQISALEQDVVKITASLSSTKANYQALQKSYADQCTISELYRNELREKEERLRGVTESYNLSEIEREKLETERTTYEERIALLETDLSFAQTTFTTLDEQKHENMLLKETIDRMRFDIDELRNLTTNHVASGQSSVANTISKSLGAELAGKMQWEEGTDQFETESSTDTVVEEEEDTEGEDVIQTIITRKKRKVPSRAALQTYERHDFEEVKDYSDTGTQHDPTYFAVSRSSQTEDAPKILVVSSSTQTEAVEPIMIARPEPIKVPTAEMEIQTEEPHEEEPSRSPSPQHIESLASSSSTVVPATPKALPRFLDDIDPMTMPLEQPPAYNQIPHDHAHDNNWSLVADVLKKWHQGVKMPTEPVPGGISEEAVEEWEMLKEELGVGCLVIDKLIESSEKAINPSQARAGKGKARIAANNRNRFYNIYNTYVFGGDKNSIVGSVVGQAMMVVGASALVLLAVSPYVVPHYSIPGGATYYDRAAWNSFNSIQAAGEGFSGPDGTAVVWDFLGRVGGGAARMARGWPT